MLLFNNLLSAAPFLLLQRLVLANPIADVKEVQASAAKGVEPAQSGASDSIGTSLATVFPRAANIRYTSTCALAGGKVTNVRILVTWLGQNFHFDSLVGITGWGASAAKPGLPPTGSVIFFGHETVNQGTLKTIPCTYDLTAQVIASLQSDIIITPVFRSGGVAPTLFETCKYPDRVEKHPCTINKVEIIP